MEIRKGLSATLRFPEAGEDPIELEDPKVTIARDSDGVVIADEVVATKAEDEDDPHWTVQVKGIDVPEADLLRLSWTDESSTFTQEVDVVGRFGCSIADIKDKLNEEAEDLPKDWKIERAREAATKDLEEAAWLGFRHRYKRERVSGDRSATLVLDERQVVKVVSLERDEEGFDSAELEDLVVTAIGIERAFGWPVLWTQGDNNYEVAYVYGHESFPQARQAVVDLASDYLVQHPTDWQARATSYTDRDGNNYRMVTAGEKGAKFNVPSANAFVKRYGSMRIN